MLVCDKSITVIRMTLFGIALCLVYTDIEQKRNTAEGSLSLMILSHSGCTISKFLV